MDCPHNFNARVDVVLFDGRGGLGQLEVAATCTVCGMFVEFIGMQSGLNMNGPAVSVDQREARLAIKLSDKAQLHPSLRGH